jgi:hypothetical protein
MTQANKICADLQKIIDGSTLMGATPYPLIAAKLLLEEQQIKLDNYTSQDSYTSGYKHGWSSAFATGFVGDET